MAEREVVVDVPPSTEDRILLISMLEARGNQVRIMFNVESDVALCRSEIYTHAIVRERGGLALTFPWKAPHAFLMARASPEARQVIVRLLEEPEHFMLKFYAPQTIGIWREDHEIAGSLIQELCTRGRIAMR